MPTAPDRIESFLPAVSVVMPAYNSAQWIEETLASVASQSLGADRLEVIVVDDGSKDATAAIAEEYLSTTTLHWQVIRQENRGPSAARNFGWGAAKAPWIQFLDADDLLDPHKIEAQWEFSRTALDDVAVIFSSWRKFGVIDSRWEHGDTVVPQFKNDVIDDLLTEDVSIGTGAQLYSRRWLERVGGWDVQRTNGEDHDLAIRVAFAGGRFEFAPSNRPLFFYRRHAPSVVSLTSKSGRTNAEVWPRLAVYVEEQSRARNELTPQRTLRLARIYGRGARNLANYDWPAADALITRLFQIAPNYEIEGTARFRLLTSLIGFRNAVWLGSRLRRLWRPRPPAATLMTVPGPEFRAGKEANVSAILGGIRDAG